MYSPLQRTPSVTRPSACLGNSMLCGVSEDSERQHSSTSRELQVGRKIPLPLFALYSPALLTWDIHCNYLLILFSTVGDPPLALGRPPRHQCAGFLQCMACDPFPGMSIVAPKGRSFNFKMGPSGLERGYVAITGTGLYSYNYT